MSTVNDEELVKRRYREFLDLLPAATTVAGLTHNTSPRSFTNEQMEARAHVLITAYRLMREEVKKMLAQGG